MRGVASHGESAALLAAIRASKAIHALQGVARRAVESRETHPKISLIAEPIIMTARTSRARAGFELQIPAGIPAHRQLRHKELVGDLVLAKTERSAAQDQCRRRRTREADRIAATLNRS